MRIGHDVESFINYFCIGIENYETNEKELFEISELRNDLDKIYNYYQFCNYEIVSFNGIHYDNLMICYILLNYERLKSYFWGDVTSELKYFSDQVIADNGSYEVKRVKYFKKKWIDIDLFLYWSKSTRIVNKISLKSLGIQLKYDIVQELPFLPSHVIKRDEIERIRTYNLTHDLGILRLVHNAMINDVNLRKYIETSRGVACMSKDAPKIASELLLKAYCDVKRYNPKIVNDWRYSKPIIHIKDVLVGFDPGFELPIFKKLFEDIKNSYDTFSKNLLFNYDKTNIVLTYGVGGLHSVNKNEKYYSTNEEIVMTSDVALA